MPPSLCRPVYTPAPTLSAWRRLGSAVLDSTSGPLPRCRAGVTRSGLTLEEGSAYFGAGIYNQGTQFLSGLAYYLPAGVKNVTWLGQFYKNIDTTKPAPLGSW